MKTCTFTSRKKQEITTQREVEFQLSSPSVGYMVMTTQIKCVCTREHKPHGYMNPTHHLKTQTGLFSTFTRWFKVIEPQAKTRVNWESSITISPFFTITECKNTIYLYQCNKSYFICGLSQRGREREVKHNNRQREKRSETNQNHVLCLNLVIGPLEVCHNPFEHYSTSGGTLFFFMFHFSPGKCLFGKDFHDSQTHFNLLQVK